MSEQATEPTSTAKRSDDATSHTYLDLVGKKVDVAVRSSELVVGNASEELQFKPKAVSPFSVPRHFKAYLKKNASSIDALGQPL